MIVSATLSARAFYQRLNRCASQPAAVPPKLDNVVAAS
jgi:hypothetical protein